MFCAVLNLLCIIVLYVSASRAVFIVFCKICSQVSVLRTVLNVFSMIVLYVSAPRTVFKVFCTSCLYVSVLRSFEHVVYNCFVR